MQINRVKGGFLSAFSSLAISAVAVKILGAIYRIPLANIIGTEGLGLYQMIFPIYSLLLIISSSALPSAISKLIAEERAKSNYVGERKILRSAKILLLTVGGLGSVGLFLLSGVIANFQGIPQGKLLYQIISPCVLIVACIALYRGSNQGQLNMKVTAYSQVIEQAIKMIFGLVLTYIFRKNRVLAVSMAVLSVTISELFALIYVMARGKTKAVKEKVSEDKTGEYLKRLLKQALPMTIAFSIYPLVSLVESKLILQTMTGVVDRVGAYGLFSGCVQTIIAIPISLINSLAIALIPTISSRKNKKEVVSSSFKFTMLLVIPFFFAMLFLSDEIANVLYFRFSGLEKTALSNMLKYSALTMLFYSLDIYFSGVLNGLGVPVLPMLTQFLGGGVRLAVLYYLSARFGIYGAIFASTIGYFVATIINLIYIIVKKKLSVTATTAISTSVYAVLCFSGIFIFAMISSNLLAVLLSVVWVVVCLALGLFNLRIFKKEELSSIMGRRKTNEN